LEFLAAGMNRASVLVIDDDPLFRSLITSILRRDFFVSVAAEGAEGYYKAIEHPPRLFIIDVRMPGWDGLRTLQAIRAHQALAKVPVMMLTSDASRQTVVAAIQGGANDYVIKTALSRDELLKKARRLVNLGPLAVSSPDGTVPDSGSPDGPAGPDETAVPSAGTPPADAAGDAAALQALIDNWD
jgi:DNA-binding response OmpR family regulator